MTLSPSSYLQNPQISASIFCALFSSISATSQPAATVSTFLVSLPLTVPIIVSYHPQLHVFRFSKTGRCCMSSHASTNLHIRCPKYLLSPSPRSCVSDSAVPIFLLPFYLLYHISGSMCIHNNFCCSPFLVSLLSRISTTAIVILLRIYCSPHHIALYSTMPFTAVVVLYLFHVSVYHC